MEFGHVVFNLFYNNGYVKSGNVAVKWRFSRVHVSFTKHEVFVNLK